MMADVVDGMVQYIRKNMPLISTELMSVSDVEVFIGRTDYSVVGDVSGFIYLNSISICCISFFQVTFLELFSLPLDPPVDNIGAIIFAWRIRGNIITTVLCCIVCDNCTHTRMSSS